eukprot:6196830-Pleurochrysis_carterae.AAC.7
MHLASLLHLLARLSLYSSSHTNELRAKTSNASGSQGHRTTTANESKLDDPCTMRLTSPRGSEGFAWIVACWKL